MLAYMTVGARDLDRATAFYDALLALLGAKRLHSFDRGVFYGETAWEIAVVTPFDGQPAQAGNGQMGALKAPDRKVVDEVHALALGLGGTDEGAPGLRGRPESGFYGAYFRDLDGNKFCIFAMGPA